MLLNAEMAKTESLYVLLVIQNESNNFVESIFDINMCTLYRCVLQRLTAKGHSHPAYNCISISDIIVGLLI